MRNVELHLRQLIHYITLQGRSFETRLHGFLIRKKWTKEPKPTIRMSYSFDEFVFFRVPDLELSPLSSSVFKLRIKLLVRSYGNS